MCESVQDVAHSSVCLGKLGASATGTRSFNNVKLAEVERRCAQSINSHPKWETDDGLREISQKPGTAVPSETEAAVDAFAEMRERACSASELAGSCIAGTCRRCPPSESEWKKSAKNATCSAKCTPWRDCFASRAEHVKGPFGTVATLGPLAGLGAVRGPERRLLSFIARPVTQPCSWVPSRSVRWTLCSPRREPIAYHCLRIFEIAPVVLVILERLSL